MWLETDAKVSGPAAPAAVADLEVPQLAWKIPPQTGYITASGRFKKTEKRENVSGASRIYLKPAMRLTASRCHGYRTTVRNEVALCYQVMLESQNRRIDDLLERIRLQQEKLDKQNVRIRTLQNQVGDTLGSF